MRIFKVESDDDAMTVTFGKFTESGFKINKAGQVIAPNGYAVNLVIPASFVCIKFFVWIF